jgi:putative flippase GtrA
MNIAQKYNTKYNLNFLMDINPIKQIILTLYSKFRNLILYGIIGILSASIDFLVFYMLVTILEIFYLIANIFSVTMGITISFILNRNYNFKVKDNIFKRFLVFILVGFFGLLLSSILLYFFVDILAFDKVISKILSILFVVLIQFLLNTFITFKKKHSE